MKVLAVCGLGIGSSIILKINMGKLLDELGIKDYSLNVADIGTARSMSFDMVVTSVELAEVLKKNMDEENHFKVISINNFIDKKEMREKVEECLRKLNKV